ncbi:MAG: zf-HC2 domain-containing protein [Desulfobacca sp.]|nr:zf-HC2 domain-containing protein [Desulfobacca sp.]
MLDCQKVKELLSAYMDDELSEAQRELVQAHLGKCPVCRQELARLERLWQTLAALPEVAPPADLVERVLVQLPPRQAPWWRSLALAASLLVGIMIGGSLGVNLHQGLYQTDSEPQVVALEVFEDFPPASLGTLLTTYQMDEGNGA